MSLRLVWGLSLALALGGGVAEVRAAGIEPEMEYAYYTVATDDHEALAREVFANTPVTHDDGRRFAGNNRWSIKYNFQAQQPTIGLCRLAEKKVTVACLITLPQLESADGELGRAFAGFLEKLKEHELRHCRIAVECAEKFDRWLERLGDRKCEGLSDAVRAEYQKMMEECRSNQSRYDHNTQHGRHEGADIGRVGDRLNAAPEAEPGAAETSGMKTLEPGRHGFVQGADGVWRNY